MKNSRGALKPQSDPDHPFAPGEQADCRTFRDKPARDLGGRRCGSIGWAAFRVFGPHQRREEPFPSGLLFETRLRGYRPRIA